MGSPFPIAILNGSGGHDKGKPNRDNRYIDNESLIAIYTLSGLKGKVVASHAAVARSIPLRCTNSYYARGAQGVLPKRVGAATSRSDLQSLTPLRYQRVEP